MVFSSILALKSLSQKVRPIIFQNATGLIYRAKVRPGANFYIHPHECVGRAHEASGKEASITS